jgi:hypothetical protein
VASSAVPLLGVGLEREGAAAAAATRGAVALSELLRGPWLVVSAASSRSASTYWGGLGVFVCVCVCVCVLGEGGLVG